MEQNQSTPKVIGKISLDNHPNEILYADVKDLQAIGIKKVINNGINDFGLTERTIICNDESIWDYIAEDGIYEKRLVGNEWESHQEFNSWYTDHLGNKYEDFEWSMGE